FLTNHDMPRVATQLDGDQERLRLAASLLLTLPGTPFLYYGEEIGMVGDKPDPDIRTPMQWSAEEHAGFSTAEPWKTPNLDFRTTNVVDQTADPSSLLSLYRRLTHLRKQTQALRHGEIEFLSNDAAPRGMLAFLRTVKGQRVLVAHNLVEEPVTAGPLQVAATGGEILFTSADGTTASFEGGLLLTLPPSASVVVRLEEAASR
ncbi:MAG: alpha-amylase family glycosyl hydrolase, partial [Acidimicrobiia bacterium]|nr:alpha-amylase family glycosyl hydrolase [Acidimicrobiia bacterium]